MGDHRWRVVGRTVVCVDRECERCGVHAELPSQERPSYCLPVSGEIITVLPSCDEVIVGSVMES